MNGMNVPSGWVLSLSSLARGADRGLGPPEVVVILGVETGDGAIADGHVEKREVVCVFGKRLSLRSAELPGGGVKHSNGRDRGVESRHVGSILRPFRAVDVADLLDFVESPGVPVAGESLAAGPAETGWRCGFRTASHSANGRRRHRPRCSWASVAIRRDSTRTADRTPARRTVVGASGDHCGCGRLSGGNAGALRRAVRDRSERIRPRGIQAGRAVREVILEHGMSGGNGRRFRRGVRRRGDRSEVWLVVAGNRVDRLEHRELGDRREACLREGRLRG